MKNVLYLCRVIINIKIMGAFDRFSEIYEDNQELINYVMKQYDIGVNQVKCLADKELETVISIRKYKDGWVKYYTGLELVITINEEKFNNLDEAEQISLLSLQFELLSLQNREKEIKQKLKTKNK